MTIGLLLEQVKTQLAVAGYEANEARAIAHVLFKHYAQLNAADLYINRDELLDCKAVTEIEIATKELEKHRPLQYIIGETEFYGLPFYVDENVLIPRPETEELAQWVINDYNNSQNIALLDIGTGSGCIAVTLAKKLPHATVYGLDISAQALRVAGKNALHNAVDVKFIQQDVLNESLTLPQKLNCIVSNPPYVRNSEKEQMLRNVLDYEPHTALFVADSNPLLFYHAIARRAGEWLLPQGSVYVEINEALPNETEALFRQYGFSTILKEDINSKPRMLKAWLTNP